MKIKKINNKIISYFLNIKYKNNFNLKKLFVNYKNFTN